MIKHHLYGHTQLACPKTGAELAPEGLPTQPRARLSAYLGAKKFALSAILLSSVICTLSPRAQADDIENLFREEQLHDTDTPATSAAPGLNSKSNSVDTNTNSTTGTAAGTSGNSIGGVGGANGAGANGGRGGADIKGVADLGKLEPFDDVAVIQKRFLPRTERFDIFLGPTLVLNDAFFLNYGVNGRFAYNFSERYGLEANGSYLSINERQVTTDLRDKRGVTTKSFVTPQTYFGLDFKWSPVYGKMTYLNHNITPFDLYFSLGAGMTGTNQNTSEPTLHLGTGQAFAHSKGIEWRWDFSWHVFSATSSVSPAGSGASIYHNLILTFGAGLLFPEANYR